MGYFGKIVHNFNMNHEHAIPEMFQAYFRTSENIQEFHNNHPFDTWGNGLKKQVTTQEIEWQIIAWENTSDSSAVAVIVSISGISVNVFVKDGPQNIRPGMPWNVEVVPYKGYEDIVTYYRFVTDKHIIGDSETELRGYKETTQLGLDFIESLANGEADYMFQNNRPLNSL